MSIHKTKLIKVATFIFTFCIIVCSFAITSIAYSDNSCHDNKGNTFSYEGSSNGSYISFQSKENRYNDADNISVSYYASEEIISISTISERTNIDVISLQIDAIDHQKINAEFRCPSGNDCYTFFAEVSLSNASVLYIKMFAYKTEYGIFVSPFSEDDAIVKFVDYSKKNNIKLSDKYKDVREEVLNSIVTSTDISVNTNLSPNIEINSSPSSGGNYIIGKLEWVDDAGISHPVRKVKIDMYYKKTIGFGYLGKVYSNDSGEFSHYVSEDSGIFNNGEVTVFVFVYAGDDNIMVKNGLIEDYYFPSEEKTLTLTGDPVEFEMCEDMTSDLGRAFQISQAIITARDYAKAMMGTTPNPVSIIYPTGSIFEYLSGENDALINITGNEPVQSIVEEYTTPQTYASWDTIMHEYGHHIQDHMNISEGLKYSHSFNINLANLYKDKLTGIKIAWQEAWATVFGLQAQDYYSSYLQNITFTNNASYEDYNINHPHSVESACTTCTNGVLHGEACEGAIMNVLWDLYDVSNSSDDVEITYDRVALGHQKYWLSTTSYESKHFADFIYHFSRDNPDLIDDLGWNLTYYQISPTFPLLDTSVTVSQSTPPKFIWFAQGGSTEYGNKFFKLVFYNSQGTEILETETVTSTSYTLSESQWSKILHSYGSTYKVAVAGLQTFGIGTDNQYEVEYISAQSSFTKPDSYNLSFTVNLTAGTRIRERKQSLQPGQTAIFKFEFTVGGTWLIQTFGEKDTKFVLYSYNGSTLARDDDSGYGRNSLITYTFEPGVIYSLNVTFYDPEDAGTFKLVMTPANGDASEEAGSITHYEDISTVKNTTNIILTSTLSPNQSKVFTFVPPETGNYTFTIASTFDTFIYVLHPGYTEEFIYNTDCNDDNGDGANPLLTKRLEAGVPYFIICSAYNPNSVTQDQNFALIISKNN